MAFSWPAPLSWPSAALTLTNSIPTASRRPTHPAGIKSRHHQLLPNNLLTISIPTSSIWLYVLWIHSVHASYVRCTTKLIGKDIPQTTVLNTLAHIMGIWHTGHFDLQPLDFLKGGAFHALSIKWVYSLLKTFHLLNPYLQKRVAHLPLPLVTEWQGIIIRVIYIFTQLDITCLFIPATLDVTNTQQF